MADTSAMLAVFDRRDQCHQMAATHLRAVESVIIPAGIMGELAYMVESRVGGSSLDTLLLDVEGDLSLLDCGERDIPRVRYLNRRYANLPLGYADATVIACAERPRASVFTFDRRHFTVAP